MLGSPPNCSASRISPFSSLIPGRRICPPMLKVESPLSVCDSWMPAWMKFGPQDLSRALTTTPVLPSSFTTA